MRIFSVICEYNPFHSGHFYQLESIRNLEQEVGIICLMSGNTVQRGEFAIMPKQIRAEAAVRSGANLVLELPFPYSMGSAAYFANAGVFLAKVLSVTDGLCFGSTLEREKLQITAKNLASASFQEMLSKGTETYPEFSYARLRTKLYRECYGEELPDEPNDILALEYMRALEGTDMEPIPLQRVEGEYKGRPILSASEIRKMVQQGNTQYPEYIPKPIVELYHCAERDGFFPCDIQNVEMALLSFYRLCDPQTLFDIADMNAELSHRLCRAALESVSLDEMIKKSASSKYTTARLKRVILFGFWGVTEAMLKAPPTYTNVLAFDEKGREILRMINQKSDFPILTKAAHYKKCDDKVVQMWEFSEKCDKLFTLTMPRKRGYQLNIYKKPFRLT